uniref:Uncharacterized protein n=2 Tax=Oryza sativa subsp. japonica TaxID=39947 RepID=Q10BJ9_ORYSJ|nr:hypothetical protein [Oryza sativa Japonica Group]ABF99535.1 transposon protein, putative, unclassified [Oryza sativa Japonica Group]
MEVDEVGGRWTFSRANEGYTSCGPVVEMSWHRAGVLLLGAQSCLPVPGVPAVGYSCTSKLSSRGLESIVDASLDAFQMKRPVMPPEKRLSGNRTHLNPL